MQKKYLLVLAVGIIAVPVLWYLVSPFFLTRRVNESMDDLMKVAGRMQQSEALPSGTPSPMMNPEDFTLPAGKDPRTESKGPTMPPPGMNVPTAITGVGQGTFEGLAGHSGMGKASLLRIGETFFVRLEDDFSVTNGPDLFVGFGKNGEYDKEAQLAPLKGNVGGQNYEVPAGIEATKYNEIWIWCRAFSVPFAKASLTQ